MATKASATVEDLYNLPDNAKAEIVDGRIILISPTGTGHLGCKPIPTGQGLKVVLWMPNTDIQWPMLA